MTTQQTDLLKLALKLNTVFKESGLAWKIVPDLPTEVKAPSVDEFEVANPESKIAFEKFTGSVHLYVLKDNQGNPLKKFDYLDKDGKSKSLTADGVKNTINVLDFKNETTNAIATWRVQFTSPGLILNQDTLINGLATKDGDIFTITPVLANKVIGVGDTLKYKIIFVADLVNNLVPVIYNFKLLTGDAVTFTSSSANSSSIINRQPGKVKPKFDFGDALSKTLYGMTWQSQGKKPSWNTNPYRGDCFLDDGQVDAKRDLSGGFSDAGDCIKPNYASAISACMLAWSGIFYPKSFTANADSNLLGNIIKHYNDYFVKCHEIDGNGNTIRYWHWVSGNDVDHQISQPPESQAEEYKKRGLYRRAFAISKDELGTEPCAATAASLAMAAVYLGSTDKSRKEVYLRHAKALFKFGDENKAVYKERYVYKSSSGFYDELCLGAIALYMATKEQSYLAKAEDYYATKIGVPGWPWMCDNSSSVCTFLLAYLTDKDYYKDKIKGWALDWLQGRNGVRTHSANSPLRSVADWGTIPQVASAFSQIVFASDYIKGLGNIDAVDYATKILNYSLGDNKDGFSYLIGFGSKFPRDPHHRGVRNSFDSKGNRAIGLGLWVAGEKADGTYKDDYNDWITNEAGSYNAPLTMLLATLKVV